MSDPITFSAAQQYSVLGHTLSNIQLWSTLDDLKVNKDWFVSDSLKEFWTSLERFRKDNGRPPRTKAEAVAYVKTIESSPTYIKAFDDHYKAALHGAEQLGWDILEPRLIEWAKSKVVVDRCSAIGTLYNGGDHQEAFKIFEQGATDLRRLDLVRGGRDQMLSAADRADRERIVRLAQKGKSLSYGVSFLDDALGGIHPNDFALIGGYTGSGKTDLGKIIAETNARRGKRVGFFALEAEEHEIERRIKFGYMVQKFKEKNPGTYQPGMLNYLDWRIGKLECLDPFEPAATDYVKKDLKNLHTYYRANSDFNIHTLDREVLQHHKKLDLIILDHVHYVDTETSDENREMTLLLKKIRDLVLGTGTPVVAVAHLRKKSGSEVHTVMPSIDSFHGSSNLQKIVTTAILMSRARDLNIVDPTVQKFDKPTYMRPGKVRLDGQRTDYVGLTFFNPYLGAYQPYYAVGRLNIPETEWGVLNSQAEAPVWAKNAQIWDISEAA